MLNRLLFNLPFLIVTALWLCSCLSVPPEAAPLPSVASTTSLPTIKILIETNASPTQTDTFPKTPTPPTTPGSAKVNGEITIWHMFGDGTQEREAFDQVITNARETFPDLQIDAVQIPESEANRMVQVEFPAGNGPDLILAGNGDLNAWVNEGLVLNLKNYSGDHWEKFIPIAREGMEVDGAPFGLPLSIDLPVLYYHHSTLEKPPYTDEELMQQVKSGIRAAILIDPYDLYGWSVAFGGDLFGETGRCIADQAGWSNYLNYLIQLKEAGALFKTDYAEARAQFLSGEVDIFLDNIRLLNEYREILGGDIGVTPLPDGPSGPASPWVNLEGVYVNSYSEDIPAALELAVFLTNRESAQLFADVIGRIPVRTDIVLNDPELEKLLASVNHSEPMLPKEIAVNYWLAFGELFRQVLEDQISPQEGLVQACAMINSDH